MHSPAAKLESHKSLTSNTILHKVNCMSSLTTLLNRLRTWVQLEAEAQSSTLQQQWSRPIAERVAKGWAIEGLRSEQFDPKSQTLKMHCDHNESRFREGDLMVLHRGNPKDANALHVELLYDGEIELELGLIRGNPLFLSRNVDGWILDQDWFDSSPFYLNALDTVADSLYGRTVILPLLQGSLKPKIDYARYERAGQELSQFGLNESQLEAIAQAYATDLLHLIQGPPGSGKTLMLAHLTQLFVDDGKRVLITALTHRAIHNALNKIAQVNPNIAVCKIGHQRHIEDLKTPCYESFQESGFNEYNHGYVIGATPFSVQSQRLANVEFDVVLFDEASQVTLPLAIMGMLAGRKYIFIGDTNQLPPVSIFSAPQPTQPSIFAYLEGRGNQTMLETTYRLNDVLAEWPSKTFYQGRLKSSPETADKRLRLSDQPTPWDFVLDPQKPIVFLDLCHHNTTTRSHCEADTVVELILALLQHNLSPEEIGVVVPYRAQSRLIRSLLRKTIGNEAIWQPIIVDTVERMQGQEREVILVSFTTSAPPFAAQMANFLMQRERINVSITRPRTKLILIGSHHLLDGKRYDANQAETFALLSDLLDHSTKIVLPYGQLKRHGSHLT